MSRSWTEVKALLDDPYVDADTKEHLLAAYIRESGNAGPYGGPTYGGPEWQEENLPPEVREYADKYKLDYGDYQEGSVDDLYDDAQAESEEHGYNHKLTDENVESGRTDIQGMQPPTEGSTTGVKKSDEIFEAARPALKLWEDFLPVNDKVPGDTLGRYGKIKLEDDIKKRFDEQVGISFEHFLDDAKRLRDAYTTLNTLNGDSESELNKVYKDWTGNAANASYQYWSEKMSPHIKDLLEYLQNAPDMIDTAVTNVFTACKDKANDVIALYQNCNGTVGSATPDIAGKVVKLASGDFDSQDEVLEVAAWVDSVTGSNLENTLRADDCGLNDENKEYTIRECKKWIRDSFNVDLHDTMYVTFKQACDDALEAVNSHYETLNNYLKEYENEFGSLGGSGDPSQTPPGSQNPPSSSTPPPSSSTPPPSSSTPPASSTPPSSTTPGSYTPPPVDTPLPSSHNPGGLPSGLTPPGSSTDPSSATSPSGIPGVGTPGSSVPGAIDPVTGQPIPGAGLTADGQVPKTATITDGDRKITVGQPDARGRSKVTVDDGKGEPREYEVDFTPDEPGETYEDGVIKAGPDGKVVIQDGDAAITLEQPPGQSDQMKMTVDDGTPTSYDFDFDAGADTPGSSLPDVNTPGSMGGSDAGGGGGAGGGGVGGGGGGGDFGGGGGGGGTPGQSTTAPGPGSMVGAQAPNADQSQGAVAAASGSPAPAGGGQQGGGGMPMGGMGAMGHGAGGQGGGDTTRQSKWRTTGSIFDDQDPAANFSGVVGRDPAEKPKTPKR